MSYYTIVWHYIKPLIDGANAAIAFRVTGILRSAYMENLCNIDQMICRHVLRLAKSLDLNGMINPSPEVTRQVIRKAGPPTAE